MPSRLPAWSGSSESCLKLSSDQISSSIGLSSGIQGKAPEGVYDSAPEGVPARGTSKSSTGSLAGPDPTGEFRRASAGSTHEVIKAGTPEERPAAAATVVYSSSEAVPEGITSAVGCLPLSVAEALR